MSRPINPLLHEVPADWNDSSNLRGFTKDKRYSCYIVQLRALGQTFQVARVKNIDVAAKTYDAALWKLLPFTPACAKPNFPADFESITQGDVDNLCPEVNRLFDRMTEQVEASGLSVEALREARKKKLSVSSFELSKNTLNEYNKLMARVQKIHFNCSTTSFHLSQQVAKTGLKKFPELEKLLRQLQTQLEFTDIVSREVMSKLMDHQELFQKLRSL